jgi:hypothetical protein
MMLTVAFGLMGIPCLADVFTLKDGSQIEGSVARTGADGRITVNMRTGIRTYHVSEFTTETIEKHFADVTVNAPKPATPPRKINSPHADTKGVLQKEMPKAILGLIIGGVLLVVLGGLWMTIAAFAESPVWGIAFLMSAGVAELAFIFVNWERAKSPLLTQAIGVALFVAAILIAK